MHFTARMYSIRIKAMCASRRSSETADYGTSNTATVATKGHQGFELRIPAQPNRTWVIPLRITLNAYCRDTEPVGGTDNVYIYQAESNLLKSSSWCAGGCVAYTSLSGYSIVAKGSASMTGPQPIPQGWPKSRIRRSRGSDWPRAVRRYGNKSLESWAAARTQNRNLGK